MSGTIKIVVASDFHFAGPLERLRGDFNLQACTHPLLRLLGRFYWHHLWMAHPFEHSIQLDRFLKQAPPSDLIVVNGDYACDTAFVGVSDPACMQSAEICLSQLRQRFGERLLAVIGDHDLGKKSMAGEVGGVRLQSWHLCQSKLGLLPFWEKRVGRCLLMGFASTLLALPVFEQELLDNERAEWRRIREAYVGVIREAFARVGPGDKLILFCHDPTALPFLSEVPGVTQVLPQVEATLIGHLHTPLVMKASRLLSGMPAIHFLGNTARRLSHALNRARSWKPFKVTLCPSPSGIQLLKDGGFLSMRVDTTGSQRSEICFHPMSWDGLK